MYVYGTLVSKENRVKPVENPRCNIKMDIKNYSYMMNFRRHTCINRGITTIQCKQV
jgi:hypothetical protein